MFSGNPTSIDRVTNGGVLYIRSAAACVTGGIQPKILAEMLGPKNVENGLAARFLMAYPPRIPKKWSESTVDPKTLDRMQSLATKLSDYSHTTNEFGDEVPKLLSYRMMQNVCG